MSNTEDPQAVAEALGNTVTRRVTPAGFFLILLLFLFLPCVAASCDVPADPSTSGGGTIGMSFTGADLAVDRYDLETTGGLALTPTEETKLTAGKGFGIADFMPAAVQILTIIVLFLLVMGATTALLRTVRARAIATLVAAVGAIVLLAVTEYLAADRLTDQARFILLLGSYLPVVEGKDLEGRIGEVIHVGPGFWLTVTMLVLIIAVNVVVLVRRGRHSPPETSAPAQG